MDVVPPSAREFPERPTQLAEQIRAQPRRVSERGRGHPTSAAPQTEGERSAYGREVPLRP